MPDVIASPGRQLPTLKAEEGESTRAGRPMRMEFIRPDATQDVDISRGTMSAMPERTAANAGQNPRRHRTPVAELLAHQERSYDLLLNRSAKAQRMMKRERVVWTWLTMVALVTGLVTGLSFAVARFPIDPPSATFAFLATIGLVVTLRAHGASR